MKKLFSLIIPLLFSAALYGQSPPDSLKPRIIVLTDISPNKVEPDDMESMIRLLVHADLFEIEGLVATTGWSNGGGDERPDLIKKAIDAYEKDLSNLRKRSGQKNFMEDESRQQIGYWPSSDYLRSRTMLGSQTRGMKYIGEENDSPGSNLIIEMADQKDERPVWILAWGGGNTPSFLYVLPNGLNNPENPGWGSWGGYFEWAIGPDKETYAYTNHEGIRAHEISRKYEQHFYPAIFNNFVARIDWAEHGKGNRNPVVVVNGDKGLNNIRVAPRPGTFVTLEADGTSDPDGDSLTYSWWVVPEAGTYKKDITLSESNTSTLKFEVPSDAAGKSIHLICEVTDNGTPNLTSYRRIIVEPKKQ